MIFRKGKLEHWDSVAGLIHNIGNPSGYILRGIGSIKRRGLPRPLLANLDVRLAVCFLSCRTCARRLSCCLSSCSFFGATGRFAASWRVSAYSPETSQPCLSFFICHYDEWSSEVDSNFLSASYGDCHCLSLTIVFLSFCGLTLMTDFVSSIYRHCAPSSREHDPSYVSI